MPIKLSTGQQEAVNTKNKNILVSAAAGSGKTFVLTQRVLSRLTQDRWDIDNFLIVTFTRDAAAEMKSRIKLSLEEKLREITDHSLIRHIEKQILLINKSDISTIDSFCAKIVKQNFHKTQLDPGYKTPDNTELTSIKNEAMDDILNDLLENDSNFRKFYKAYASKSNDRSVTDMIEGLYTFADSMPYPDKWLDKCLKDYEADTFKESIWGRSIISKIEDDLAFIRIYIDKILRYFNYEKTSLPSFVTSLVELNERFIKAYKLTGPESLASLSFDIRANMASVKGDYISLYKDVIKGYFNCIKSSVNNCIYYSSLLNNISEETYTCAKPFIVSLVTAARAFSKRYNELKTENQMAEFNDISHLCLNILRNEDGTTTETAKEYQQKYKEIIIDEYQDSNYLQEAILTSVSKCEAGKNNIFMVGDVKQAIYRFRQTTPELFIEKYDKYKDSKEEELILLSENYRSRAVVLDFCNMVFSTLMDKKLGEVDYTEDIALNPKAQFPPAPQGKNISDTTEVIIVDAQDKDQPEDPLQAEAIIIANRIKELISEPLYIYDKDEGYRPVQKKDIVILVSKRTKAGIIYDQLNSSGINCTFDTADPLFKTTEVKNIISLLNIIDNPYRDIDIVNVLHSPMYNLSFDDIAEIRLNSREKDIYTTLSDYKCEQGDLAGKINTFISDIEYYRNFSQNNSIGDLISEIYNRSNYFNYTAILDKGDYKRSNLRLFREKAYAFESGKITDLHSFVEFIEEDLSDSFSDRERVPSAATVSDNNDAVRIMTIHKSKGLEFPVVFVSQLHNRFSRGASGPAVFHRELGIGLKYIDTDKRIRYTTLPYETIAMSLNDEELSENLRLLYVALTRAKEKLILTGVMKYNTITPKSGKYAFINSMTTDNEKLYPFELRNMADCFLFWIIAALKKASPSEKEHIVQKWINVSDAFIFEDINWDDSVDTLEKLYNAADNSHGTYSHNISKNLSYTYPYDTSLPSKISITEIKRALTDEDTPNYYTDVSLPSASSDGSSISAGRLGTVYHTIMENMDFTSDKTEEDILSLTDSLVNKGIITAEEKKAVNIRKIMTFISSPLFARIKDSQGIFKETPFIMNIKASEIGLTDDKNANMTVHGIIDLYFREGDEIVLVDYKTDRVFSNVNELVSKYRIQLELYSRALKEATGLNVKERIIYSIDKGESVNV